MPRRREGGEVSVSQQEMRGASYLCTSALNASHVSGSQSMLLYLPTLQWHVQNKLVGFSIALHGVSCLMSVTDCELWWLTAWQGAGPDLPSQSVAVLGEPGWEARYCLSSCQQPFSHYPGVLSSSKLLACVRHVGKHLLGLLKDHLANVGPRSQRKGSGRNRLEVIVVNWSICSLCMGWGQVCVLVSYTLKHFFFIAKVVLLWSASLHPLQWGMLAA